jgi:hypothetical protein
MADMQAELIARIERLEALAGVDNETQPALAPDALAILPEDHPAHEYQARTLKQSKGPAVPVTTDEEDYEKAR